MITFFQSVKISPENFLNKVTSLVLGVMEFVKENPNAAKLALLALSARAVNSCFMVYCQYQNSEMLIPNLFELPKNLTEYCMQINPSKPPFPFLSADSMSTGDLCDLKCTYGFGN